MKLQARAKINLTLEILGKRPDGYHDLELVFQPISLADELEITENGTDELVFTCSVKEFENEDNLVCRGYRLLHSCYPGKIPGLTVHLEKKIPSGAGLGGGSTDCSAFMVWLNHTYGLELGRDGLIRLGAGLGADVPACIIPHATLGRGIGEQLTDICTDLSLPLLLIKPDMHFSTGEMYARADSLRDRHYLGAGGQMVQALERGDARAAAGALYNIFEEAVPEQERIQEIREALLKAGALGARMTGSGSAVYGFFENTRVRDLAFGQCKDLTGCSLYAAETVNLPEALCVTA